MAKAILLSIIIALSGCAQKTKIITKTVKVPVPIMPTVPIELKHQYQPGYKFEATEPGNPKASVAFTESNEIALKLVLQEMMDRIRAFEIWVFTMTETQEDI